MDDVDGTVTTERLHLWPFEPGDVEAYARIWAKPENVRHLPGGEGLADRAAEVAAGGVAAFAALWAGEPGYGSWAVLDRASGGLLGHAGLRLPPELGGETELLYLIDSSRWRQGYATEAARAALAFGFNRLRLERIVAFALPENAASLRVLDKVGMRREPGLFGAFGLRVVRCVAERAGARSGPA